MPRVKIDYVVSFSSEDPENPASNILEWEVSKKKWLCSQGEPSCSIVLQLSKAVMIESINIGAHHAATVEVLVGLSEKPNEPFQVLVPSCVLLSPAEARRDAGAARVRSFGAAQLTIARARRWDRVRVACAQPYNRHCKYGLSFVHIHEPESALPRTFAFDALPTADEEFRPGELFASARRSTADAQIRRASMDAIRNDSDKHTKLVKIPIAKTTDKKCRGAEEEPRSNRRNENLIYTDDDVQPHEKIDRVVQRHRKQKDDENGSHDQKSEEKREKYKPKSNSTSEDRKEKNTAATQRPAATNPSTQKRVAGEDSASASDAPHAKRERAPRDASLPAGAALAGVVFALSGYENPQRAELRAAGLRLGARYSADWRACSHLVCAFPNTPKMREARAAAGGAGAGGAGAGGARAGGAVACVAGEWLSECAAARRRLPWRWFALDARERTPRPADWRRERADESDGGDMDTDDEIEKVLQRQLKENPDVSPAPAAAAGVTSGSDSDGTDRDERPARPEEVDAEKVLPNFFEGLTFTIADDLDAEYDRALLARYIRAYGGLVVEPAAGERAHYLVCAAGGPRSETRGPGGANGGPVRVRPEWLWRRHRARSLDCSRFN